MQHLPALLRVQLLAHDGQLGQASLLDGATHLDVGEKPAALDIDTQADQEKGGLQGALDVIDGEGCTAFGPEEVPQALEAL